MRLLLLWFDLAAIKAKSEIEAAVAVEVVLAAARAIVEADTATSR
jgi:hypothetical protein